MQIVGRKREIAELTRLKEANQAEFVALYGRRRVGKTWLVRNYFQDQFTFYTIGIARGNRKEQLKNFYKSICSYSKKTPEEPKDWYEAFDLLKGVIKQSRQRRKVVFLDELPWMDTQKSEFLKAIDLFWNSWGCMQSNLLFIVCGSATSWMVKNIILDKGGLHNRLTCHLHLAPFTLSETKSYLHSQGLRCAPPLPVILRPFRANATTSVLQSGCVAHWRGSFFRLHLQYSTFLSTFAVVNCIGNRVSNIVYKSLNP